MNTSPVDKRRLPSRWLSLFDLIAVFVLLFFVLGAVALIVDRPDEAVGITATGMSLLLVQHIFLGSAPFGVTKFGLGPVKEWFFKFAAADIGIGLVVAMCMFAVGITTQIMVATAIGLDDETSASNVDVLSDVQGSGSVWLLCFLIFLVVVSAPITEELFYRGLILRVFEGLGGRIFAVLGSSVLFGLFHRADTTDVKANVVLMISLGAIGAVLAVAALRFERLGPTIIAHMIFNGSTVFLNLL